MDSKKIAHDIKTPLTVILGYSEMIKLSSKDKEIKKWAELIIKQVYKVNEMLSEKKATINNKSAMPKKS